MTTTFELMKRIKEVLEKAPATMRDVGDILTEEGFERKDVYRAMRKMNKSSLVCSREMNSKQSYARIWKVKA